MLQRNPWPAAVARLAAVLLAGLVPGAIAGHPAAGLALALAAYLGYNAWHLVRLERWLRLGIRPPLPLSEGLWTEIFGGLHRLERRHKRRRKRLTGQLRRFRDSADAMPDAAIELTAAGEMVWWNARARDYLGLRWPQDEGQRVANLVRHPAFTEFLASDDGQESVKVPSPVDARRILEVRIVPYGEDRRLLLARDVTRLFRLETMRRDFVANITHELRTPLTVIQGMAETLAEESEERESLHRPLQLMEQQTQRMGRLIDDLLLLSRLETSERARCTVEVAVPEMLDHLVEEARSLSGGRHHIALESDHGLKLIGDEGELRSAFSNLVGNAVKYTPDGGRIDMRWFESEAGACLSIADTGMGIPAHHLPRLTERFYRVDSGRAATTGGTGLGLAIVKHVLSRHGARLEVSSRVEEGSTFTCVFPEYLRDGERRAREIAADLQPRPDA